MVEFDNTILDETIEGLAAILEQFPETRQVYPYMPDLTKLQAKAVERSWIIQLKDISVSIDGGSFELTLFFSGLFYSYSQKDKSAWKVASAALIRAIYALAEVDNVGLGTGDTSEVGDFDGKSMVTLEEIGGEAMVCAELPISWTVVELRGATP